MFTLTQKLDDFQIKYPLERISALSDFLFVDIETTGFTAKSSSLYMIGVAFYENGCWNITQYFAENEGQETELLEAFSQKVNNYRYLVHFNGNNFDLPYLMQKCEQYGISCNLNALCGIDIYKRIAPYKFFLKLPNCKQKTIESFLEINRIDTFNGGELIGIYKDYVTEPTDFARSLLIQHNFDDMKGMLEILPILSYSDIFEGKVTAKKVQSNHYTDYAGNSKRELIMTLSLPCYLPKLISVGANECYFRGEGDSATLKVPVFEEELKYFYANYGDYYYLPTEDVALHKSVAGFVDREHRLPATAATCYTRKHSCYLPQWEILVEPFFKRDYKSKSLYFELTDELKRDRETFHKYANHIIKMIAASY